MFDKKIVITFILIILIGGTIALLAKPKDKNIAAELNTSKPLLSNNNGMKEQEQEMKDGEKTQFDTENISSSYIDYSPESFEEAKKSQRAGRKIVLFFHAKWCPYCQEADKDFKTNIGTENFPKNTTLIKTDYDSQTALKKKYGVIYQHTFVQIDHDGNQIAKWISGATLELKTNTK